MSKSKVQVHLCCWSNIYQVFFTTRQVTTKIVNASAQVPAAKYNFPMIAVSATDLQAQQGPPVAVCLCSKNLQGQNLLLQKITSEMNEHSPASPMFKHDQ